MVGILVVVVVVVVVALLIGLSFAGAGPLGGVVGDAGTFVITVSHYGYNTISTTVYVGSNYAGGFEVAPQTTQTVDYTAHWTGNGCYEATVTADGSGGSFGPTQDSRGASVCNGGSASVSLTV